MRRDIKKYEQKLKLSQQKGIKNSQDFLKKQEQLEENLKFFLEVKSSFNDEHYNLKTEIENLLNKSQNDTNEYNNQSLEYLRSFLELKLNNIHSEITSIKSM